PQLWLWHFHFSGLNAQIPDGGAEFPVGHDAARSASFPSKPAVHFVQPEFPENGFSDRYSFFPDGHNGLPVQLHHYRAVETGHENLSAVRSGVHFLVVFAQSRCSFVQFAVDVAPWKSLALRANWNSHFQAVRVAFLTRQSALVDAVILLTYRGRTVLQTEVIYKQYRDWINECKTIFQVGPNGTAIFLQLRKFLARVNCMVC